MARNQQLCFLAIFASLFCVILACGDDDLYVIGSGAYEGLVLDGSDPSDIRLQYFTNSSAQLWKFQRSNSSTLFYIINNYTGKALDFEPRQDLLYLLNKDKKNVHRQQWNLRLDGRIVNSQNRRNVDVQNGAFSPGTRLVLVDDNGSQAQEFVLTKMKDYDFEEKDEK